VTAGTFLILLLPFLLSLAGKAGTPRVLCLVTSILALLLSVEPFGPACHGSSAWSSRSFLSEKEFTSAAHPRVRIHKLKNSDDDFEPRTDLNQPVGGSPV
jgi:hypothetical protein